MLFTALCSPRVSSLAKASIRATIHKLLHNKSHKVRLQAAIYLSRLRDPKTVQPLMKCLVRDDHYLVRAFCATALGNLGSAQALPALKTKKNDENSFVRRKVKQAIERIHAQVSVSGGQGYQVKYKPRARLFVLVTPPKRRRWGVPKRVAKFTQRTLRVQLNDRELFEVARPGVVVPQKWLKRRRIPAVAITMTVTNLKRRKNGKTIIVTAKAHAVVTRYPTRAVQLISDTEAKSTQTLSNGRIDRRALENLYQFLERQAVDGAIRRLCLRLNQM